MTPLFAQRAAEEFDRVLDGRATRAVSDRYADLLGTVELLQRQPDVAPRPEFVADLRSRLMTAAETDLVAAPVVIRRLPTRETRTPARRLGTIAASLVIVGGSAGMAAAASGSLPGESLYPVKRGIEHAGTAVRIGDASKGSALLGQAATRLDEASQLQGASADPELILTTIAAFRDDASDGADRLFTAYRASGRAEQVTEVRTFAATQMADIARMSTTGDSGVQDALLDAADTLADIDEAARELCESCGPAEAISLPLALTSGAGAPSVDNLLARPVEQAQADIAAQAKAARAARAAQLARLQDQAERTAGQIPSSGTTAGGSAGGGLTSAGDEISTITPGGGLVPTVTSKTGGAVKGLVTGVTGSVKGATKTGTPLDDTVGDLTDTVDEVTGGVTDGLLGGN